MKKRLLALVTAVTMLAGTVPVGADTLQSGFAAFAGTNSAVSDIISPEAVKAAESTAKELAQKAIDAAKKLTKNSTLEDILIVMDLIDAITKEQVDRLTGAVKEEYEQAVDTATQLFSAVIADPVTFARLAIALVDSLGSTTPDALVNSAEKIISAAINKYESLLSSELKTALQKAATRVKEIIAERAAAKAEDKRKADQEALILAATAAAEVLSKNLSPSQSDIDKVKAVIAKADAATQAALKSQISAAQALVDAKNIFDAVIKRLPSASQVTEAQRALIEAAAAAYCKLTPAQQKEAQAVAAKTMIDEARKVLDNPKLTFANKLVTKNLNKAGTATKVIPLKKGKSLSLKAKSSTGAKISYSSNRKKVASVSPSGKITARKSGNALITVTSGSTKVVIKIKVRNK